MPLPSEAIVSHKNPDEAHYRLQANVLSVAKTDPTAAQQALMGGYGGPLMSAVGGAAAGAAIGELARGRTLRPELGLVWVGWFLVEPSL